MMTLTPQQYKQLVASVQRDDEDGSPYPFYSGRGMFGDTCFGWTTSSNSPARVQLELARIQLHNEYPDEDPTSVMDLDGIIDELVYAMEDIGPPSSDGMGRATIYYWRNVRVDPAVRDDEDYDED